MGRSDRGKSAHSDGHVGHQQPPPQLWDLAVAAIVEHTEQG